MSSFKDLRIVDNFYQTSLFFPMPAVLVSTIADSGETNCGSYSLVQPYYVAGKDYYAMLLCCRNSSNTCQNIIKRKKCAINFITDERKYFKEAVRLGWPGDTTEEKMKNFAMTLEDGECYAANPNEPRPKIVKEAFQVIECTWDDSLDNGFMDGPLPDGADHYEQESYHNFNGITSPYGAHFILKVDKILMKEKYYNAIVNGVKKGDFPPCPVDYGYRDSKNFWYHKHRGMIGELLPVRQTTLQSVRYAADRVDPSIHFTDDALQMIVNVPRIFLPTVLKGCVTWAKENNVTEITEKEMKIINDKRSKEKS